MLVVIFGGKRAPFFRGEIDMKRSSPLRHLWFFFFFFLLSSLASILLADEPLKIRVRKGDTLSYLSFKTYGKYNLEIGAILKKENPRVKDIDLIYAGQQLNFPTAEEMNRRLGGQAGIAAKREGEKEISEARPPQPPAPPTAPVSDTQVRAQKGVITYLEGQVQVKKSGETQWAPGRPNMILGENDQIKVLARSRAELILDNQSVLRLSENTVLTIQKLEEEKTTGKENTRMRISLGRVWVKVSKFFNPASRSDMKTPTVIAGVQGTIYQLSVAGDQSTTIQVYEGAVNVYNPFPKVLPTAPGAPTQVEKPREIAGPQEVKGPTTVSREEWTQIVLHQFQQITVTGREVPQPVPFSPGRERENAWVQWNEERDADFKPPARLR
jgi:phage tail protein X